MQFNNKSQLIKGVGKTQFLFKTCSSFLFRNENKNKSIIYIDTENNFNVKRYDLKR